MKSHLAAGVKGQNKGNLGQGGGRVIPLTIHIQVPNMKARDQV